MTRILILGANGKLARNTTRMLLERGDVQLTLFLRQSSRLENPDVARVRVVEGDATDVATLATVMSGHDVVYANLAGEMKLQAECIVQAMQDAGLRRLIFISSMGIYGEVPGKRYERNLDPYRHSAQVIEASNLNYTVLRPGWFTHAPAGPFRITEKGEPFIGHDISIDSLSGLIADLVITPGLHVGASLGVSDR